MTAALAIFVKTPGLSPVKTRLAAVIGVTGATCFHLLAARATAAVAQSCVPALVPYWAVAEDGAGARAAWPDFAHVAQGEGDLGARLHHVYKHLQLRHGRVLMIGADTPQLTSLLLRRAMGALDDRNASFVLGPAADGGFWLFGGRKPVPRKVWDAVRYSQAATARELREALAPYGSVAMLPELRDVDEADDLPPLARSLDTASELLPAQSEMAEWLRAAMEQISSAASPE